VTDPNAAAIQGITEDDIANYLANTPSFFERHAELLASITLASPHGARAVSLQQRQMDMLRERIKGLEKRIIEMIRNAHENTGYVDRLHDWTLAVMLTADRRALPGVLADRLKDLFMIPHVAVRVWDVDPALADAPFVVEAGEELRRYAHSLEQPYCGANTGFEAARWCLPAAPLKAVAEPTPTPTPAEGTDSNPADSAPAAPPHDPAEHISSLAMIPLRRVSGSVYGLLVLGSPDPTRYRADMGTDLLIRIGELASASLARLLGAEPA
jgi:uncharacterized protein YigA (DUF484 family)